jgi:hypothetical protein
LTQPKRILTAPTQLLTRMKCSICKMEGHKANNKKFHPKMKAPAQKNDDVKVELVPNADMSNTASIICPEDVIAGCLITKEKRHELFGHVAGGAGSRKPEIYQRKKIVEGTCMECPETNMRINLRTNTLINISHPNTNSDGFDYSEDFDGIQTIKEKRVYINLKCVVGKGGAQTRSLREVYWFVEGQLKSLKTVEDVYFANILDGDEAHSTKPKFEYLLNLPEFDEVKNRVYIGDLKGYFEWFKNLSSDV